MIPHEEDRQIWRHNITEDLETLASPAEQLQFQRDVPFVNISVELACNWFDGHYFPDAPKFVAYFSDSEWKALAEFNAIFDSITSTFDAENYPEIDDLLKRPNWQRVIEAAKVALVAFDKS